MDLKIEAKNKATEYFWPSIERKGIGLKFQSTTSDRVLHEIEFVIEEHRIMLKAEVTKGEERVTIFVDDKLHSVLADDKTDVRKVIELFDHRILIHFKVRNKSGNWVIDMLWETLIMPVEGLYVAIDGKPLQGSLADPGMYVKTAIYGYYFFAGFELLSLWANHWSSYVYVVIAGIACLFAVVAKRCPTVFMIIGLVWGILEIVGDFIALSQSNVEPPSPTTSLIRVFVICLKIGITVNFVKGLIGIVKINSIKKGKTINMV